MTNGANFVFKGTGAISPHGWTLPSGSHMGNKNYYRSIGGGVKNDVTIDIRNYNSCGGSYGNYGLYGDSYGSCGGNYGSYGNLGMFGNYGMYGGCGGGSIFGGGYGYGSGYGYGGGCCGNDSGISKGGAWAIFGVGAGLGVLSSILKWIPGRNNSV